MGKVSAAHGGTARFLGAPAQVTDNLHVSPYISLHLPASRCISYFPTSLYFLPPTRMPLTWALTPRLRPPLLSYISPLPTAPALTSLHLATSYHQHQAGR